RIRMTGVAIPLKRRWFQFSLRTLLVATAFVGLVLAPIVYYRQLAHRQQQIKAELEVHRIVLSGGKEQSQRPQWLKKILGDDSAGLDICIHVYAASLLESSESRERAIDKLNQLPSATMLVFPDQIDDQGLVQFRRLTNIQTLFLERSPITSDGLKHFRGCQDLGVLNLVATPIGNRDLKEIARHKNLEILYLWGTNVTDEGMQELRPLKRLRCLHLDKTRVTDAGLRELQQFQSLEMLGFGVTSVSDAGIRELRPLKNLTHLDLGGTKVTDECLSELEYHPNLQSVNLENTAVTLTGIRKLKAKLPSLRVNRNL
ncbi:MAG TPA: hypothetical protein VFV87_10985, partial [Pirellulaceae bacterium]|nr:hypothetical protein [Pirellulaceae bacterium]